MVKTDVRYAVEFPYLKTIVPNSVAWLYQPGSSINQPVMFSTDPTYYLKRQFNDRLSNNGSIFMTGDFLPDFSSRVIALYGRNCMDLTLFGSLSNYREDAYYQEHPTLYLLTPGGDYQLDIFAGIRTKLSDSIDWKVSNSRTALMSVDLPYILANSFIQPKYGSLPVEGDSWALLATESPDNQGSRYVLYARKRPIYYQGDVAAAYVNKLDMDSRKTENGIVTAKNVGQWMHYSQDDPVWDKLVFEVQSSSRKRGFGGGGCGPTAIAMAIANIVEKEELVKLGAYASSPFGYRFCTCSVNDYRCSGKHLTYQMKTVDEYHRYFPLAIASFATGNNVWGVRGRADSFGTSMRYLEHLGKVFDLSIVQTSQLKDAFALLKKENTIAIACTSGHGSPFTSTSHFLVLAGIDDEYLYILDPLRRTHYRNLDKKGFLEVVEPGLVRVRLENATECNLSPIYLIQRNIVLQADVVIPAAE